MKKVAALAFLTILSLSLSSCSKTLVNMDNYYKDDSIILGNPSLAFYNSNDEIVSSFNPDIDDGHIVVTIEYGSLIVKENWTAVCNMSLLSESESINITEKITDCRSETYAAKYTDVGNNEYTYTIKSLNLFKQTLNFSSLKKIPNLILFTVFFYDENSELFESFRSYGNVTYSGLLVTSISLNFLTKNVEPSLSSSSAK